MKRILFTAVLLSAGTALAFSPELRNEDSKGYEYELVCGGSTTHSSIGANTTQSLAGQCGLQAEDQGRRLGQTGREHALQDQELDARVRLSSSAALAVS